MQLSLSFAQLEEATSHALQCELRAVAAETSCSVLSHRMSLLERRTAEREAVRLVAGDDDGSTLQDGVPREGSSAGVTTSEERDALESRLMEWAALVDGDVDGDEESHRVLAPRFRAIAAELISVRVLLSEIARGAVHRCGAWRRCAKRAALTWSWM